MQPLIQRGDDILSSDLGRGIKTGLKSYIHDCQCLPRSRILSRKREISSDSCMPHYYLPCPAYPYLLQITLGQVQLLVGLRLWSAMRRLFSWLTRTWAHQAKDAPHAVCKLKHWASGVVLQHARQTYYQHLDICGVKLTILKDRMIINQFIKVRTCLYLHYNPLLSTGDHCSSLLQK